MTYTERRTQDVVDALLIGARDREAVYAIHKQYVARFGDAVESSLAIVMSAVETYQRRMQWRVGAEPCPTCMRSDVHVFQEEGQTDCLSCQGWSIEPAPPRPTLAEMASEDRRYERRSAGILPPPPVVELDDYR